MPIRVGPDVDEATHHLKLTKTDSSERGLVLVNSQGKPDPRAINRTSVRGSTVITKPAQGRYDDRQPPYVAVEQNDWSGGRGADDFDRSSTRFLDSHHVMSALPGVLMPAPAAFWQPGIGAYQMNMPNYENPTIRWWGSLTGFDNGFGAVKAHAGSTYLAFKFVANSSFIPKNCMIVARAKYKTNGDGPGTLRAAIFTHNAGPDEPLAITGSWTSTFDHNSLPGAYTGVATNPVESTFVSLQWASGPVLTVSTTYWLVINAAADTPAEWEIGTLFGTNLNVRLSANGSTWASGAQTSAPMFALFYDTTETGVVRRFFEYKRGHYHIESRDDGTSPSLYRHGYRGVVDSSTATTIVDAAALGAAVSNELVGAAVHFIGGTGKGQERRITANAPGSSNLTFSPARDKAFSTDTEWVTLGAGRNAKWNAITGLSPGINNPSGDPLVVNGIVYFPQGDGANIIRYREYNNAGTWTVQTATDGTNKAVFLTKHRKDDGTIVVVRAQNSDANGNVSISVAPVQPWGTDLVFETPIRIGDNDSEITNVLSHDGYLWVIKEDGLWAVANDIPDLVLDDLKNLRSNYTGTAAISKTPYMYFSAGTGLEEFYGKVMVDMGPNRDQGFPVHKQGYISAIAANAKWLFVSVDHELIPARSNRVSTVHMYNGQGWHEIFRAPFGERIRSLHFQVPNPGDHSYLWIGMDRWTCCLPFPMYQFDPFLDPYMRYHWDGYVESGWKADNLLDIEKHWALITLFMEYNTGYPNAPVNAGFWYDTLVGNESKFVLGTTPFVTYPSEKRAIRGTYAVGKRLRDRIRYDLKLDNATPIRVNSAVLDYVGRYPTGWAYDITFLLSDFDNEAMEDLQGDPGDYTASEIISFLDTAKDDPLPLVMRSVVEEFDNKLVLVDPASLSVLEVTSGESRMLVGRLRLLETQV